MNKQQFINSEQFQNLWFCFAKSVKNHEDDLNKLDQALGDADHGSNLARGLQKATLHTYSPMVTLRYICRVVAMVLLSKTGGISGTLWGSALLNGSKVLPDQNCCDDLCFVHFLETFVDTIAKRGKSRKGDKTMLDVFIPAVETISKETTNGTSLQSSISKVATLVPKWAERTSSLQAKRGKAVYLGLASIGHVDPGAKSSALWWQCLDRVINDCCYYQKAEDSILKEN